ncbi:response regulator transcription factor [Dietzia sp. 179-F 9C3 NHS]|uniref:response regulator transcription factor n=1 Tax=Dietzia sp. 179-F 9C3 NHS TaxID=3374295 RepID=UPI00387A1C21
MSVSSPAGHDNARRLEQAEALLRESCADAVGTAELIDGVRRAFTAALGPSFLALGATDPDSTAFGTGSVVDGLPRQIARQLVENEYLVDDFNTISRLHRSPSGPVTLHRATQGLPHLSPRYRDLYQPNGLGPELRVVFAHESACLGVATVVRASNEPDFSDHDLEWVRRAVPHITSGLRRTVGAVWFTDQGPREPVGVVTFDPDGNLLSMTTNAASHLSDLWLRPAGEATVDSIPGEARIVVTMARALATGGQDTPPPISRLRGRSGRWLTLRGDRTLSTSTELTGLVLTIEPSRPPDILPLLVASFGLSARERQVLTEMSSGRSTTEIAERMVLSTHTVRDHVKSILRKTGSCSRAELWNRLYRHGG